VKLATTEVRVDGQTKIAAEGSCRQWNKLAARLRSRIRSDLFERWFAPLRATMDGDDLVLIARDEYAAAFVHDNYLASLGDEAGSIDLGVRAIRVVAREAPFGPPADPVGPTVCLHTPTGPRLPPGGLRPRSIARSRVAHDGSPC
jgi:hypothetical protein